MFSWLMPESLDILLCTRELKVGGLGGMKPTLFCHSKMSKKGSFIAKSFACICRAHLSFIIIYEGFYSHQELKNHTHGGEGRFLLHKSCFWGLKSSLRG